MLFTPRHSPARAVCTTRSPRGELFGLVLFFSLIALLRLFPFVPSGEFTPQALLLHGLGQEHSRLFHIEPSVDAQRALAEPPYSLTHTRTAFQPLTGALSALAGNVDRTNFRFTQDAPSRHSRAMTLSTGMSNSRFFSLQAKFSLLGLNGLWSAMTLPSLPLDALIAYIQKISIPD